MALEKITSVKGRGVYVPGDDLDTDQIIPARFLRCVSFDGIGEHLFEDLRFDDKGNKKGFPIDNPRFAGATVLLSNGNFGCGSSREHAPQAIAKWGFRAVVAESFAEIFFGNSTTLGIPCVAVSKEAVTALAKAVEADPSTEITVDLVARVVRAGGASYPFTMKAGACEALAQGVWDPVGQLLENKQKTIDLAARLPYLHFADS